MKKLFLGSVALVALGLGAPAAFAAERPVPAPAYAPPPPVPVYTWTGCYAGANAGTSSGRSTQTVIGNSILTGSGFGAPGAPVRPTAIGGLAGTSIAGDLNLSGFIGGFQGGCNYQMGAWVVGAEVDGMATNKEGQNFETGLAQSLGAGRANWVSQTQERWLVTARGKLGLAGFLVGAQTATGVQQSDTRTGWTLGAGYEYALGYGWSIKGEYLYVKFDDYQTFNIPTFGGTGLNIAPRNNKLNDNIFRAGMNYKFW